MTQAKNANCLQKKTKKKKGRKNSRKEREGALVRFPVKRGKRLVGLSEVRTLLQKDRESLPRSTGISRGGLCGECAHLDGDVLRCESNKIMWNKGKRKKKRFAATDWIKKKSGEWAIPGERRPDARENRTTENEKKGTKRERKGWKMPLYSRQIQTRGTRPKAFGRPFCMGEVRVRNPISR